MTFTGWPQSAMAVLERLEGDPSPSERELVRRDRERLVRVPMIELFAALADRDDSYRDHAVWRYATGVRTWQRQSGILRIDRQVEVGVGFDLDGLHIQGSWWYAGADQRARYRTAVAGRAGARWQRIVDELRTRGYEIGGDVMARVPRQFPPDHLRADLLRHRSLTAAIHREAGSWLHTSAPLDHLQQRLTELRPMLEWLSDHVAGDHLDPPSHL